MNNKSFTQRLDALVARVKPFRPKNTVTFEDNRFHVTLYKYAEVMDFSGLSDVQLDVFAVLLARAHPAADQQDAERRAWSHIDECGDRAAVEALIMTLGGLEQIDNDTIVTELD